MLTKLWLVKPKTKKQKFLASWRHFKTHISDPTKSSYSSTARFNASYNQKCSFKFGHMKISSCVDFGWLNFGIKPTKTFRIYSQVKFLEFARIQTKITR